MPPSRSSLRVYRSLRRKQLVYLGGDSNQFEGIVVFIRTAHLLARSVSKVITLRRSRVTNVVPRRNFGLYLEVNLSPQPQAPRTQLEAVLVRTGSGPLFARTRTMVPSTCTQVLHHSKAPSNSGHLNAAQELDASCRSISPRSNATPLT